MISIESFTRARELVNRIDNIDAQITRSFTENERTYESISEIINIDNISTIINNFYDSVSMQGRSITDNLKKLKEFLNAQIAEYEQVNQNASTRFQQTQAELTEVSDAASSALGDI